MLVGSRTGPPLLLVLGEHLLVHADHHLEVVVPSIKAIDKCIDHVIQLPRGFDRFSAQIRRQLPFRRTFLLLSWVILGFCFCANLDFEGRWRREIVLH